MKKLAFGPWVLLLSLGLLTTMDHVWSQQPPTIEEALQAKGIDLSLDSLRDAVRNGGPEVTPLAAAELATKKDAAALPIIRHAADASKSPQEKQGLAEALITFGDPLGNVKMREVCQDREFRQDSRLIAANLLLDAGDNGCLGAVVQILANTTDHSVRGGSLDFIKRSQVMPTILVPELRRGLVRSLSDEVPSIRQSASSCIVLFRLHSERNALAHAVAAETDAATRTQMEKDLEQVETAQLIR